MQEYFKIGEISKLYHIGVDSLRYYEKIGLLQPVRSESGYRHYSIQDIWKLNIIRDLRSLNFSMEQIARYLKNHTTETTLSLLREEQQAIEEKIYALQQLQKNVASRARSIQEAMELPLETITLRSYPERRCFCIPEGYSEEHEMDVLIKKLLNMDPSHLYLIGNNRIGTAISMEKMQKSGDLRYEGVFVMDSMGDRVLPAGSYLTVAYRGSYSQSCCWAKKLLSYGESRGIRLKGDILEILLVDIHISSREEEYITELQVLTE